MGNSFLFFIETYFTLLYILHILISAALAVWLSLYTMKRFARKTAEIERKDAKRLLDIRNENIIFKIFFKVSLHKNNRITNIAFMFLFNYTMPVIGYIFSIWITWYLKNIKYEKIVLHTNILNLDEFRLSFLKIERIFGEGSMKELMTSEYASKSKKLKALSSLSNNHSPENLKVIRETLSSKDDEIRMFGYAIINKAEKNLNVKMNKQLQKYNTSKAFLSLVDESDELDERVEEERENVAEAANALAHLYWEMIYTELSHESLKQGFLEEVVKYTEEAKEYYSTTLNEIHEEIEDDERMIVKATKQEAKAEYARKLLEKKIRYRQFSDISTKLYVLMGRVNMSKENYDLAITDFVIAQELNTTNSSFILPYIAEIHFLMGHYNVVNSIIGRSKDLELNYTLNPIVEQWKAS